METHSNNSNLGKEQIDENTVETTTLNSMSSNNILHDNEVFSVLAQTSMDGLWFVSLEGKLLAVNDVYCQMTGYSEDELVGMSIDQIDIHETPDDVYHHIQLAFASNGARFETSHRCKDGRIIHVEISTTPLKSNNCMIAFIRDLTDQKQSIEALNEAKEFAEKLIQTANTVVIGLDLDANITVFNHAAENITGYMSDEVIGQNWLDLFIPPRWLVKVEHELQRLSVGGLPKNFANPILTKDGEERHLIWQNNEIYHQEHIIGIISFGIDVTETNRTEALLRTRLELSEFALKASIDELYQKILDNAEILTNSQIGFFHLLAEDQNIIELQMWSSNTLENMCATEGQDLHYPVQEAGVWVDCVHQRKPVIHNDYESLTHKQGLPDGHAPIVRLLTVPIMRANKIVALMGVGNKDTFYTQTDVDIVSQLGNMAWDIIQRKLLEEQEDEQRVLANALVTTSKAINSTLDFDEVLHRILQSVDKVIPHSGANIMLLDETQSNAQIVHYCDCYAKNNLDNPKLNINWNIVEYPHLQKMIDTGEAYIIQDVKTDSSWNSHQAENMILSYIGAPIIIDNKVIGLLNVDSTISHFFDNRYLERLNAFAVQAAIAIRNARMFQKLASYNVDLEEAVKLRTQALTRANDELERLGRAKDEFVSNVSHELRTPITSLALRAYLIRTHPDKLEKHLGVIERETKRLEQIIEDLLRLSRLDQNRVELELSTTNLSDLIAQVTSDRSVEANQLDIHLEFENRANQSTVFIDSGLIGQVLSILLTNAFNYSANGSKIVVTTHNQIGEGIVWAGFSVRDFGPGILPQEKENIFDRFYRGTVGRHSKAAGTGLGLAIAKKIIDAHNGEITVESNGIPGDGTRFTVWLPTEM